MKILVIPGWGQTVKQYRPRIKGIKHDISLYEFPGFGTSPGKYTNKILYGFALDLRDYLEEHSFDMIVSCDMGCNVLLRALQRLSYRPKPVLINPICGGMPKLKSANPLFSLLRFKAVRKRLDRACGLDTENAHVDVLINTLQELAFDEWKPVVVPKNIKVYVGEVDTPVSGFNIVGEVIPDMKYNALEFIGDIIAKEVFLLKCSSGYSSCFSYASWQ